MRELLKMTAGGLIAVLAVTPALAQTGTMPKQEQPAPRNQGGTTPPPAATSPDSSSTGVQKPGTSTQDSTMKGTKGTTGSGMSQDSSTPRDMSTDSMRGMKGAKANVRQAQEALKAQGHDPGPVDGVMGPQTKDALRAYQRAQNLTETGQLDQQTTDKLGLADGMGTRQQSR